MKRILSEPQLQKNVHTIGLEIQQGFSFKDKVFTPLHEIIAALNKDRAWSVDYLLCPKFEDQDDEIGTMNYPASLQYEQGIFSQEGMGFIIFQNCEIELLIEGREFEYCFALILSDNNRSFFAISHLQICNTRINNFLEEIWPNIQSFLKNYYGLTEELNTKIYYGPKRSIDSNLDEDGSSTEEEDDAPGRYAAEQLKLKEYKVFKSYDRYFFNTLRGTSVNQKIDYDDDNVADSSSSFKL